jgi:hypothetical protein
MSGAGGSGSVFFRGVVATAVLALLAACGGGGAGGAAGTLPTEGSQGSSAGSGSDAGSHAGTSPPAAAQPVAIAPVVDSPEGFALKVDAHTGDEATLDHFAGGPLFAAWNPTGASDVLQPGMKVMFFGSAAGCQAPVTAGPVARGDDGAYASAATRATLAAATPTTPRWAPAAAAGQCDAALAGANGPSMVQVDARDAGGAIGLYTDGGLQDDGSTPFLAPWGDAGQDGQGANAHILGTFVAFRQDWHAADPIQPWLLDPTARIVSTQTVGATATGDAARPSEFVQVKQQMAVTFLNLQCARTIISPATPCQIQYLLNTALLRTGVSDWSQVAWANAGGVMFDPGQGGIPVITGPVRGPGLATSDAASGLELFSSQGNPTQHAAFTDVGFDVRLPFDDLMNAARIVAGRKQAVAPDAVDDAAMAALWGAGWADPSQWVLLSAEVGQEVYNPYPAKQAWIGGSFSQLAVGPQG